MPQTQKHAGPIRSQVERTADWVAKRKWSISVIVLYAATMTLPAMDRFFTWDEAVFWSQSGGLDGAPAEPLVLVASRELGSSALIGILRVVENDLAEVRFLWASLAFLVLLWGARRLIRHVGDKAALIFFLVYGTHWLVIAWTPALYSNVFAAGLALLAATFYLDLIADDKTSLWKAAWFGVLVAATFAMRPVEAALVVVGLAIHFFVLNWSKVRPLIGKVALGVGTALVAGGIPWVVDSVNRFGSVSDRIEAGLAQGGQVASGLRINVLEYFSALSGDRVAGLPGGSVPSWPRFIVLAVSLGAAAIIVVALVRKGLPAIRGPAGLFIILSATNAAFFIFWREAVNERYMFITMIFAAALFGWALSTLAPSPAIYARWLLAGVATVWLATQVLMVSAYEETRDANSERSARVAATMRTLSGNQPCEVLSRYGTPQLQVASGCQAKLYTEWADALSFAADNPDQLPKFIYGRDFEGHFDGLPDDWTVIPLERYRLAFWLPEYERSAG